MSFLNGDDVLKGIKRGAEKFGGAAAVKVVKKMAERLNASQTDTPFEKGSDADKAYAYHRSKGLSHDAVMELMPWAKGQEKKNGLVPSEPEPYGLGMGGANTEQESRGDVIPPSQADGDMENTGEGHGEVGDDCPLCESHNITEAHKIVKGSGKTPLCQWCGRGYIGEKKNEGGDVSSSGLGYQSGQKTTTVERSEEVENGSATEDEAAKGKAKWDGASKDQRLKWMADAQMSERNGHQDQSWDQLRDGAKRALLGYGPGKSFLNSTDWQSRCLACGTLSNSKWTGQCKSGCGAKYEGQDNGSRKNSTPEDRAKAQEKWNRLDERKNGSEHEICQDCVRYVESVVGKGKALPGFFTLDTKSDGRRHAWTKGSGGHGMAACGKVSLDNAVENASEPQMCKDCGHGRTQHGLHGAADDKECFFFWVYLYGL